MFHGEGGAALAPRANEGAVFMCSQESAHSVTRMQRGAATPSATDLGRFWPASPHEPPARQADFTVELDFVGRLALEDRYGGPASAAFGNAHG